MVGAPPWKKVGRWFGCCRLAADDEWRCQGLGSTVRPRLALLNTLCASTNRKRSCEASTQDFQQTESWEPMDNARLGAPYSAVFYSLSPFLSAPGTLPQGNQITGNRRTQHWTLGNGETKGSRIRHGTRDKDEMLKAKPAVGKVRRANPGFGYWVGTYLEVGCLWA